MAGSANLGRLAVEGMESLGSAAGELGGRWLSSPEIIAAARDLAKALRTAGSENNEPVILFIANEANDLVGFLGLWLAGCVATPIHVASPEAAVQPLISRLGSRFAIRNGKLSQIGAAAPPPRQLLSGAALIVFTSGSTGQPKGVVVGHEGLAWKLEVLARLLRFTRQDVVVVPLQLTFIFGIWVSLLSLLSGSRLLLAPRLLAAAGNDDLQEVTVLAAVPTLLRTICTGKEFLPRRLGKVLTGGEPFSPTLAEKLASMFTQARIFDLFGLTETGSCDFCAKSKGQLSAFGTIGRSTEGISFRIAEAPGLELPIGTGELQISTPARMLGYLDDPGAHRQRVRRGIFQDGRPCRHPRGRSCPACRPLKGHRFARR